MRRRPLGKRESVGVRVRIGYPTVATWRARPLRQRDRFARLEMASLVPPKPCRRPASPEACGTRSHETPLIGPRHCRATRLTSATVTARSPPGPLRATGGPRRPLATTSGEALIELRSNCARAISCAWPQPPARRARRRLRSLGTMPRASCIEDLRIASGEADAGVASRSRQRIGREASSCLTPCPAQPGCRARRGSQHVGEQLERRKIRPSPPACAWRPSARIGPVGIDREARCLHRLQVHDRPRRQRFRGDVFEQPTHPRGSRPHRHRRR